MEHKKIHIDEDRISNLSRELIERIMDLLPVRDAARTCLLSSKWRYVWAHHPCLVLDRRFWYHMKKQKLDCANIVSSILLHHVGHIHKFILDVSVANVSSDSINSWISSLCSKNIKVLHLYNGSNCYQVELGVLLNSQLTELRLSSCYIKEAVGCFTNIRRLILDRVQFDSVVLTTPSLTSLSMTHCTCKSGFDVSAPRLASLSLSGNQFLNLKTFFTCADINMLSLGSSIQADGKHLVELLAFWPKISQLMLDEVTLKHLATGSIPADNDDTLALNLGYFHIFDVELDSEQLPWILYLLKKSPLLSTFGIQFGKEVKNDIDEPMDFNMDQLRCVMLQDFSGSRNQVKFVKSLLKHAPLVEEVLVDEDERLDLNKRMDILRELLVLQRINPKAEIYFEAELI